jgi:hypothetical protein
MASSRWSKICDLYGNSCDFDQSKLFESYDIWNKKSNPNVQNVQNVQNVKSA